MRFMRSLELGFALVWLLLGVAITAESRKLGLFGMFGPDRGFFPLLAGLLMSAAAAGLMLSRGAWVPADRRFWTSRDGALRVAIILAVLAAMIFMLPRLGFLLTGALLAPVMVRFAGPSTWLSAGLIGVGATAAIHLLFVRLLQQPLPEGPLQGLF
jgi:hypothetical protein